MGEGIESKYFLRSAGAVCQIAVTAAAVQGKIAADYPRRRAKPFHWERIAIMLSALSIKAWIR
ncbi:MAG: hypothetical protein ACLQFI_03655 [Methylocella sp.]|jgi:hypothetical protein